MLIQKIYKTLGLDWAVDGTGYWDIVEAFSYRYIVKKKLPYAMTSEEWSVHNKFMKDNHPIHVWMFDTMPGFMWRAFVNPWEKAEDFLYYLRHDWNDTIRIKTLYNGWNDCHHILEHGMFAVLNEYVERECANMNYRFGENNEIKTWSKKLRELPFARYIFSPYRSRADGLDHIQSMIDVEDENGMQIESQVSKYTEVRDLYLWWNDVRPVRPDPNIISGWSDICDLSKGNFGSTSPEIVAALKKIQEIEKQYDAEDEANLIRLVKIRDGLWT